MPNVIGIILILDGAIRISALSHRQLLHDIESQILIVVVSFRLLRSQYPHEFFSVSNRTVRVIPSMKDVHEWKTFMRDTTLSIIRPLNTIHILYFISFSFGEIVLALKVPLPSLCNGENEGESHAFQRPARRAS
ncbi:hypothetical protein IG631_18726 [Alternaria alternata]|nr:hypothetical protein IG631_18726 [Alternaria alternata]